MTKGQTCTIALSKMDNGFFITVSSELTDDKQAASLVYTEPGQIQEKLKELFDRMIKCCEKE